MSKVRAHELPLMLKGPRSAELKYWAGSNTGPGLAGVVAFGFRSIWGGPWGWGLATISSGGGGMGLKVMVWKYVGAHTTVSPALIVTALGRKSKTCDRESPENQSLLPARTNQRVVPLGPGSLRPILPWSFAFCTRASRGALSTWAWASIWAWAGTSVVLAETTSTVPRMLSGVSRHR